MDNLLPIGTIVRLYNGEIDLMIIGRFLYIIKKGK